MTLVEWIAAMEPAKVENLSAIHLERLTDGTWRGRAAISVILPGGLVAQAADGATITAHDGDLPVGVSAARLDRYPDRHAVLDADIEAQLAALRASGLLGPLGWTRSGPVRGGPSDGRCTYVVKLLRYPTRSVLGRRQRNKDHPGGRP